MSRCLNGFLICYFLLVIGGLGYSAQEDPTYKTIKQAYGLLHKGEYDKALQTIALIEAVIRAEKETKPRRVLNILIVKSRAHIYKGDGDALEKFLSEFEKEFASDSTVSGPLELPLSTKVRMGVCYERMVWYRKVGDLNHVLSEHEKLMQAFLTAIEGREDNRRAWRAHVSLVKDRGDIYRAMGDLDSARQEYESALAYLKAHPGLISQLPESRAVMTPADLYYEHEVLPKLIEQCSLDPKSPQGILYQKIAWRIEEGNHFFYSGKAYNNRKMYRLALERYKQTQRVLESNKDALSTLVGEDKARYTELQEELLEKINLCNKQLDKDAD